MTNHVHLIVTPTEDSNLSRAFAEAHKKYTRHINHRQNWSGYLWQGRFSSFPMDFAHLMSAAAYVELNPVRAGIVEYPWDYKWSSVHAHLSGKSDAYVNVEPLLEEVPDWKKYLQKAIEKPNVSFESHTRTGRPLGDESFLQSASKILGRDLIKKKPGPKPKEELSDVSP